MTLESDLGQTARDTVRVPANIMGLLRQSYDTREKALDWCLAIAVVAALTFAFRDEIRGMFDAQPNPDPNAGMDPEPQANVNVRGAFPDAGPSGGRWPALYAYNMPSSRIIRMSVGPSGVGTPANPSANPSFGS
jgi:hypothetical protein